MQSISKIIREVYGTIFQPPAIISPHLWPGTIQCQLDMWSIRGEELFAGFGGQAGVLVQYSLDCLKGNSTGNHGFYYQI